MFLNTGFLFDRFSDRILPCIPGCPRTYSVDQTPLYFCLCLLCDGIAGMYCHAQPFQYGLEDTPMLHQHKGWFRGTNTGRKDTWALVCRVRVGQGWCQSCSARMPEGMQGPVQASASAFGTLASTVFLLTTKC